MQPKVRLSQLDSDEILEFIESLISITRDNISDFGWNVVSGISGPTTYDVTPTSASLLVVDATGGDVTINLHSASSTRVRPLNIKRIDDSNNLVTIQTTGSPADTIDGVTSIDLTEQWTNFTLFPVSTTWLIL